MTFASNWWLALLTTNNIYWCIYIYIYICGNVGMDSNNFFIGANDDCSEWWWEENTAEESQLFIIISVWLFSLDSCAYIYSSSFFMKYKLKGMHFLHNFVFDVFCKTNDESLQTTENLSNFVVLKLYWKIAVQRVSLWNASNFGRTSYGKKKA